MRNGSQAVLLCLCTIPLVQSCSDRLGLDSFPVSFDDFLGSDDPPAVTPAVATPLGLTSAVAGDGILRVEWRAPAAADPAPDVALILTDDLGAPVGASPFALVAGTTELVLPGMTNGQILQATLGFRAVPTDSYSPVGPTLSARPGAPVYVNIAAAPGGDGTSPATAYDDLILAVLIAFSSGGGNVWVAGGDYPSVSLPLFANVDVYGGFPGDFDLAQRDTLTYATRFHGLIDLAVATLLNAESLSILDGVQLLGEGIAAIGLEVEDSPFEGRKIEVTNCKRGMKIRRGPFADSVNVYLTASSSKNNDLQGLSGEGPLKLFVDGCTFSGNGAEGLELAGWLAPEGENLRLNVRDCVFSGNADEGLDADMIAPSTGGTIGGTFTVRIESCTAQTNGLAGFLLDIDYEEAPAWSSDIVLSGCYSRANGGPGIALDLDSSSSVLIHRVSCSSNRSHGLQITSETHSGTATVSASAFVGNQGRAIESSLGNFGVLASHCVVSGNSLGGMFNSPAPLSVVSSVAYLQPAAWAADTARFVADQAFADPTPFQSAARGFAQIHGQSGDTLTLTAQPAGPMDAIAEVGDDGVARDILGISGTTIQVDAAPTSIVAPHPIAFHAPGSAALEDYELSLASIARDAGLPTSAGGTSDAGPHGTPNGGIPGAAGLLSATLFHCAGTSPTWVHPIAASADLELRFSGGTPDPVFAPLFVEVVDANEQEFVVNAFVAGDLLHLPAPSGGWPIGTTIRLHEQLPSVARDSLAAPVVIPLKIL